MDSGITVGKLRLTDASEVREFCKVCESKGYRNNSTLGKIKFKDIPYWAVRKHNKIICISGCHVLFDTSYRILARAVALESRAGLSRYHFNSLPFYYHIQPQIEWAKQQGGTDFFITTNKNRDESGKMERMHRVMQLLEKQGLLELTYDDYVLNGVTQSLWKLNYKKYLSLRL
jgi:hypothetical protein